MHRSRRLLLSCLLSLAALPALAVNPMDVQRVQRAVARIHTTYMRQVATTIGYPLDYIESYLPGRPNDGKKLSEELDLSAKQYRAVNRLIAQRNYAIREAYMDAGIVVPKNTDIKIL